MAEKQHPYLIPSPLEPLHFKWATTRNLKFYVKRDDLIHEAVSGNKWRKLKYTILQAQHLQKAGIITFGGAYSNHILATAHACMTLGLKSLAFIRGEELTESSNAILQQCSDWGMDLKFISREEYRLKDDWDYLNEIKSEYSAYYIVPEGGKSYLGTIGCQEIIREIEIPFDEIWLAQGTCTTSLGLAMAIQEPQKIHGVPVLSGYDADNEIKALLKNQGFTTDMESDVRMKMEIHAEYSFGGYGKTTPELLDFIQEIKEECGLDLDPVYTGKAFYAMTDVYRRNQITDRTIIFLHTGGLVAGQSLLK
ncbi:MAG: pyridoxal-phosphate dependent enzyme [Crocinitomicaceae bacterium]